MNKPIDTLATIGSLVIPDDHIEAILDGLPKDYDTSITSITSRLNPYTIKEIETLLPAQEECFEKHKITDSHLFQANIVAGLWSLSIQQSNRTRFTRSQNHGGCGFFCSNSSKNTKS